MSERDDAMEAVADVESGPETSRITHIFAGVLASDLDASIWEMDEHPGPLDRAKRAQAGGGRITLAVSALDALLGRFAVEGIKHRPVETYSNGVRHVKIPDPDGNAIAFAEPPDAT
jgi:hypothetical protein